MGAPLCLPQWSQICQTECYPCDRIEALPMCPVGQLEMVVFTNEADPWTSTVVFTSPTCNLASTVTCC